MQEILYSDLASELQGQLGSTGNIKVPTSTQRAIFNRVLDDLSLYANWKFCIRRTNFNYLPDLTEYNMRSYVGLQDYKSPYLLGGIGVVDDKSFHPGNNRVRREANNKLSSSFNRLAPTMLDGDHYLLVKMNQGHSLRLASLDSPTEDGEWEKIGDAEAPATDNVEYRQGSASLKFRADTDLATGYAGIENSTRIAADLSDYVDASSHLVKIYIPASGVTSVTIYFGSSTTAYWAVSVSTPINKSSIQVGWNYFKFDWENATQIGSPDSSNVKYLAARCNYVSATYTDNALFRIDDWTINQRFQLDFDYFSSYMVIDTDGNWKQRFTETTDYFAGPRDTMIALSAMAFNQALIASRRISKDEKNEARLRYTELKARMKHNYGQSQQRGPKKINIKR